MAFLSRFFWSAYVSSSLQLENTVTAATSVIRKYAIFFIVIFIRWNLSLQKYEYLFKFLLFSLAYYVTLTWRHCHNALWLTSGIL